MARKSVLNSRKKHEDELGRLFRNRECLNSRRCRFQTSDIATILNQNRAYP
jgi:hypothetical protein